jgi:mono/diheme cytochrome c family protein
VFGHQGGRSRNCPGKRSYRAGARSSTLGHRRTEKGAGPRARVLVCEPVSERARPAQAAAARDASAGQLVASTVCSDCHQTSKWPGWSPLSQHFNAPDLARSRSNGNRLANPGAAGVVSRETLAHTHTHTHTHTMESLSGGGRVNDGKLIDRPSRTSPNQAAPSGVRQRNKNNNNNSIKLQRGRRWARWAAHNESETMLLRLAAGDGWRRGSATRGESPPPPPSTTTTTATPAICIWPSGGGRLRRVRASCA